jgi:hypothetical protein
MRRLAVPLLIALMLTVPAAARARPQRDWPIAAPPRQHAAAAHAQTPAATASNDGPSWTVAILAGAAVMLAFGCAGVFAGRAGVRPQTR